MASWKYVLSAVCSVGMASSVALAYRAAPEFSALDSRSEVFTDVEPVLLPETVTSSGIAGGGEFVFAVVVDTTGKIETATVQTLLAKDSASAQAVRQQLGFVRYVPGRMIEVMSSCVRINRTLRHCGGKASRVRLIRRRVLLHLEFGSAVAR